SKSFLGELSQSPSREIVEKQELSYTLISIIGSPDGVYEDHVEFLEKHLKLYLMKKIQAIFMWAYKPEATRDLLEELPNLKVIAVLGVGIDHLDLKLIFGFDIKVTNTPFAVSSSTADIGMALTLTSARRIVEDCSPPDTKHFNINWYEAGEQAVGAVYCQKMEDLLPQADFVMLTVNLTPQTCKLIGRKGLELMKPTATLINICRGSQVDDQDALLKALQTKRIKAAALDVTYPELLPRDHALLHLKNVITTPHIGSATSPARRHMMERMVETVLAAVNGLPVPHEVHE
uniref:GRHPR reductase n=1 Tax=Pseudonaja textilis TaxID=8673 RepID=A0A670XQC5_PSETE